MKFNYLEELYAHLKKRGYGSPSALQSFFKLGWSKSLLIIESLEKIGAIVRDDTNEYPRRVLTENAEENFTQLISIKKNNQFETIKKSES